MRLIKYICIYSMHICMCVCVCVRDIKDMNLTG